MEVQHVTELLLDILHQMEADTTFAVKWKCVERYIEAVVNLCMAYTQKCCSISIAVWV